MGHECAILDSQFELTVNLHSNLRRPKPNFDHLTEPPTTHAHLSAAASTPLSEKSTAGAFVIHQDTLAAGLQSRDGLDHVSHRISYCKGR